MKTSIKTARKAPRTCRRTVLRVAPLIIALAAAFAVPVQAQVQVYGPGLINQPIQVKGEGTTAIVQGGTTITPEEPYPEHLSGTGVQVLQGGEATLQANDGVITINTHGHAADGLFVGAGKLTVNGGGTYINVLTDQTDDNQNSRGIYTVGSSGRSEFTGTDVYVVTQGSASDGLRSYGKLATVTLNNATLTTLGDRSRGVTAWGGTQILLNNVDIVTSGADSQGIWLTSGESDQDTVLTLNGGSVSTSGNQSNAVHGYGGTHFIANDATIHTTGNAYAVAISGGKMDGSTLLIQADASRGLVVSGAAAAVNIADSTIRTTGNSTQTVWVSGGTVNLDGSHIVAEGSNAIPVWTTGGQTALNGSSVSTTATGSRGLLVQAGTVTLGMHDGYGTLVHTTGANADAAGVLNGASLSADGATLLAEGSGSLALRVYGGDAATPNTVDLKDTTVRSVQSDGIYFYGGNGAVNMDGGSVSGGRHAVWVAKDTTGTAASGVVNASNGALISGQVGAADGNTIDVHLSNGSRWDATLDSVVDQFSNDNSLLDLQAASDVASRPTDSSAYRQVLVRGDYTGNDGVVAVNTWLNDGGVLSNQYTDRLLINGDASGETLVQVKVVDGSVGAHTSPSEALLNHEGISVVQVGGLSTANAFRLQGDYVAPADSPYTYRLFAYGPGAELGAAASDQSLVGNVDNYWDYRLQSAYVSPGGVTPDPETPNSRPMVVPQVASYLTAPVALQYATYADLDSLHRRLGEVRDDRALGLNSGSGEFFIRAYGGDFNYNSNRNFASYGYDASGDYSALQLGANLYSHASDTGVWRFGAAGTAGRLNYRPDSADGASRTKADTHRISAYATYQSDAGWYLDSILSYGWFDGHVSTDARGKVMNLKGESYAGSVEAGYPFDIGYGMTLEPQAQVIAQHLRFDPRTDRDGLDVALGSQNQVMGRFGARLTRPVDLASGRVTPYVGVHLVHSFTGDSDVNIGGTNFRTGEFGDAMRYSAGVSGTVSDMLSVYGEVARMQALGSSGVDGWIFNGGLRLRF